MKHWLLLLSIFCLHSRSFAQSLIPLDSFYIPGASWTEVYYWTRFPCSEGEDFTTGGIVYKIVRDTAIMGKTYHLLSSCNKGSYGYMTDCSSHITSNFADSGSCGSSAPVFAMLRTDSNRVYFTLLTRQGSVLLHPYDCDSVGFEYLLYDFNLSVGSVVPATILDTGIRVTSIDSVSLSDGEYVPRYNGQLVYGVGAKGGFLNYWHLYVCGPGPVADQYLLCYDNPYFSYHFTYPAYTLPEELQNDCFDMDAYIRSLSIHNVTSALDLNVYPNPATNNITVTAPRPITSLVIVNPVGRILYSCFYNNGNATSAEIDVSRLPAGIYFLKVNDTEVKKFVRE